MFALARLLITGVAILLSCSSESIRRGSEVDEPDGGMPDADGRDGGPPVGNRRDGGSPPPAVTDCELHDLNWNQQWRLLCKGADASTNRIAACPSASHFDPANCENNFISLSGEFTPLSMNDVDGYTIVTAKTADNYPGFAVVDPVRRVITDSAFFHSRTLQIGSDQFVDTFHPAPQMGATLFKGSLAIPANFTTVKNGISQGEHGAILLYPWHKESGTFDRQANGLAPEMFVTTNPNPTLFFQEDPESLRVVNNGNAVEGAGIDFLHQIVNNDNTTRFEIDRSKNILLGVQMLEPLVHPALSPDQGIILLASGANLLVVTPQNGANAVQNYTFNPDEKITATQWFQDGAVDKVFVSTTNFKTGASQVYRLKMSAGTPGSPSRPKHIYGKATVSGIDVSNRMLYQGLQLPSGKSAIIPIGLDAF